MKALVPLALCILLGVSHSASINYEDDVKERFLIDPIIKMILEGLRPKLANLTIGDINQTIADPNLNATIIAKNITIRNADKFEIKNLKSSLVPLKLTNLTLFWKSVGADAFYNMNTTLRIPQILDSMNIFGKGNLRAFLYDLFFTVGANMEMKNNALQIKPKGLFGFDVRISKANITLDSVMGSQDFGKIVSSFLSNIIPGLVEDLKKPLFDAFQDDIIKVVNQVLRKNGTTLMDEQDEMSYTDAQDLTLDFLNLKNELEILEDSLESDQSPFEL